MATERQKVGTLGEDVACSFLQNLGYKLYGKNVRIHHDEIDLILFDPLDRVMVFVEVKSRSRWDPDFSPSSDLTSFKLRKMQRGARSWMARKENDHGSRIDVVYVIAGRVVEHLIDYGS